MDEQTIRDIYEAAGYERATADIVAWLRSPLLDNDNGWHATSLADAIERGDFRKVTA